MQDTPSEQSQDVAKVSICDPGKDGRAPASLGEETCPSIVTLRAYLHEPRSRAAESAVGQHVEQCGRCLENIEKLVNDDADGIEVERAQASPERVTDQVNREVSEEEAPETIDTYHVRRLIGHGSFGSVYCVYDESLECEYALKILKSRWRFTPDIVASLQHEARMMAKLDHPGIVGVYKFGSLADGRHYMVSKYVRGRNVADLLQEQPLTPSRCAELVAEVADALDHVHDRKIVHCDIKPRNILVDNSGIPYLTDFGLASQSIGCGTPLEGLTPDYASPEQARAQARGEACNVTASSDIFSLGVVLYELLTGQRPFRGTNTADVLRKIQFEPPQRPRNHNEDVSKALEQACLRALNKSPEDRYQTAKEFACALRQACLDPGPNPYRGLEAFRAEDADQFFGREPQIAEIMKDLGRIAQLQDGQPRLLAIIGPSGCGKSSLLQAGVLAQFQRQPPEGLARGRFVLLRPGAAPLKSLAEKLSTSPTDEEDLKAIELQLRSVNAENRYVGLRDILHEQTCEPVVILVDQFEDVFKHDGAPKACEATEIFLNLLLFAASAPPSHVTVVLTLRSDFLEDVERYAELKDAILKHNFLVMGMTEIQLRRAIAEPARQADRPFESWVIDALIEQSREAALPLLQYTLTRIWDGFAVGKKASETLVEIRGVGGALADRAQTLYEDLPTGEQKAIAKRVFIHMVYVEGERLTRRQAAMTTIARDAHEANVIREVLQGFVKHGLVRFWRIGATSFVEFTHDTIINRWEELRTWVRVNPEEIKLFARLDDQFAEWEECGRRSSMLLRSAELDRFTDLFVKRPDEFRGSRLTFYNKSVSRSQRFRWAKIGAGLLVVVFAITSSWLWYHERQAREIAAKEVVKKTHVVDFTRGLFLASDPIKFTEGDFGFPFGNRANKDMTAEKLLARGDQRVEQLSGQPEVQVALLTSIGTAYYGMGLNGQAMDRLQRAKQIAVAEPSVRRLERLGIDEGMAMVCYSTGDLRRAEELLRTVRKGRQKLLSPADPQVLRAMYLLALVLVERVRYSEAEELLIDVINRRIQTSGDRDQAVGIAKGALAGLYMHRGDYYDMLKPMIDGCKILESQVSGANVGFGNLVKLYLRGLHSQNLGDAREAEKLLRKTRDEAKRLLGPDHFFVAHTTYDHAATLWSLSESAPREEAERLRAAAKDEFAETRRIILNAGLNEDHSKLQDVRYKTALFYFNVGNKDEGKRLVEAFEKSYRNVFGGPPGSSGHYDPQQARDDRRLAVLYSYLGPLSQAEGYWLRGHRGIWTHSAQLDRGESAYRKATQAHQQGDVLIACRLYQRAIPNKLGCYRSKVHFALALAYDRLGDGQMARKHLKSAQDLGHPYHAAAGPRQAIRPTIQKNTSW